MKKLIYEKEEKRFCTDLDRKVLSIFKWFIFFSHLIIRFSVKL